MLPIRFRSIATALCRKMMPMTVAQPIKRYTPQEYYRLERAAHYKSDYYNGEIFDMSGGTIRHSLITANIVGELRQHLKGKPCTAYESNLRLVVKATGLRCYPDASVYCQPLEPDDEDSSGETVINPTVLFEVLSKSTEGYDRGFKSRNYRQIKSLRAYAMVSQEMPHVEIYVRQQDGSWLLSDARGLDGVLQISAIDVELPLAEIYHRVDFTAIEPESESTRSLPS
jgi:Uma2 family endonuclease